jgi:RNA polymerase sigma-70 factor (ECF subfamily)
MSESDSPPSFRGLYDLMERYIDGDPRAFSELHRRLDPRLRAFLAKLVADQAAVDDLVQLTLLKAHVARHRFELRGSNRDGAVGAWYFAIARNIAMDHLRGRYRTQRRTSAATSNDALGQVADDQPNAEQLRETTEEEQATIDRVRDAISRLAPKQREVVELHKLRGLTMAEIALRLDIGEGALRVRAHRAYRALLRLLGSDRS